MTVEGVLRPSQQQIAEDTASDTNRFSLWNDPEFYSVSKADS